MMIDNRFEIGDIVYLKTDPDQYQRMVSGIIVGMYCLNYELALGDGSSTHHDFEISTTKNVLIEE